MKDACVFKNPINKKCAFPKTIRFCLFCRTFLPNDGRIKDNIDYINFVTNRNIDRNVFIISTLALFISIISTIIAFFSFLFK